MLGALSQGESSGRGSGYSIGMIKRSPHGTRPKALGYWLLGCCLGPVVQAIAMPAPLGAQDPVGSVIRQEGSPAAVVDPDQQMDSLLGIQQDSIAPGDVGDSAMGSVDGTAALPQEVDEDEDGVPAISDFCPNTPLGQPVDAQGCAVTTRSPWLLWGGAGLAGLLVLRLLWIPIAAFQKRRIHRAEMKRIAEVERETLRALAEAQRPAHGPWAAAPRQAGPWATPPGAGRVPGEPPQIPPPSASAPTPPAVGFPEEPPPASDVADPTEPGAAHPEPAWTLGRLEPGLDERSVPIAEVAGGAAPAAPPPGEVGDARLFSASVSEIGGGVRQWKTDPLVYGPGRGGPLAWIRRHPVVSLGIVLAATLGGIWYVREGRGTGGGDPSAVAPLQAAPVVVALTPDSAGPPPSAGPIPSQIRMLAGDGQGGTVGETLPVALEIRVEDADGEPVPDVPVFWEATVGGGRLSPGVIQTDSLGVARTLWTLGPQVVTQYAIARVAGFGESGVAFEADAEPGVAARLVPLRGVGLTGPPGELLDEAVVVRVEGEDGQPLEGIAVAFAPLADGSVSDEEVVSDPAGEVRTAWTLGARGDSAYLQVRVVDAEDVALTLSAGIAHPRISAAAGVVTGGTHTCALSRTGLLTCWGGNQAGQLGTGGGARAASPAPVSPGTRFSVAAAGLSHTCAVEQGGEVYCWGDNANGQLGTGSRLGSPTPTPVATDNRFRSVSAGTGHTCGVTRGSTVLCWGSNVNGQLGEGSNLDRDAPSPVAGGLSYQAVSVGWFHTCALAQDGRATCWGRNAFGQLGDDSTDDRNRPTPSTGPMRFTRISAGGAHTCGLGTDSRIYCWGQNNYGQIGDGSTTPRRRPVPLASGGPWSAVAVGGVHSCGLTVQGDAYCWGRNTNGQLGDGTTQDRREPTPVSGGLTFTAISASGAHTCGTTPGGQTFCWGFNVEGQLGDGSRENRLVPTFAGSS